MNGVSFSLKKYTNGSCFSLSLVSDLQVYEWVSFSPQKYINGVSFSLKKYMNR